jgi:hypothetical protein
VPLCLWLVIRSFIIWGLIGGIRYWVLSVWYSYLFRMSLSFPLSLYLSLSLSLIRCSLKTGRNTDDRWLLFKYGGRLRNISPMALHDDQLEAMRGEKVEGEGGITDAS